MSALTISAIIFAFVFAGALFGMYLRVVLPEHHLSSNSKDAVRLGMGLITTMAALVLGLLIAWTKGSYETQRSELMQMSANILLLDRVLIHYGPETKEARELFAAPLSACSIRFGSSTDTNLCNWNRRRPGPNLSMIQSRH